MRVYELYRFLCGRILFLLPFLLLPFLCLPRLRALPPYFEAIKMSFYVYVCLQSWHKDLSFVFSIMAAFGRDVYEYASTSRRSLCFMCQASAAAFIIAISIYTHMYILHSPFSDVFFCLGSSCSCRFCINFIFWVCQCMR